MKCLILFRHAKTEARAPGGKDLDRVLTPRGRRDAAQIGEALAHARLAPDLVLISPSARTRETWRYACEALGPVQIRIREALYNATPEEVAEEVALVAAEAETVMVIGHNPSLQEFSVNLLIDGAAPAEEVEQVSAGFPTAAAAVFRLGEGGRVDLEVFLRAGTLGGGGELAD